MCGNVLRSVLQNSDMENEQRRRLEQAAALAASKRDDIQLRKPNTKKQQVGLCDLRLSTTFLMNCNQMHIELMQRLQNH